MERACPQPSRGSARCLLAVAPVPEALPTCPRTPDGGQSASPVHGEILASLLTLLRRTEEELQVLIPIFHACFVAPKKSWWKACGTWAQMDVAWNSATTFIYCCGILVTVAETWTRQGSLAMVLEYGSFIPGIMARSCLFSNFVVFLLT